MDQVELEVARIRTDLASGVLLEQLQKALAQRSTIAGHLEALTVEKAKLSIDNSHRLVEKTFHLSKGDNSTEMGKAEETDAGLQDRRLSLNHYIL